MQKPYVQNTILESLTTLFCQILRSLYPQIDVSEYIEVCKSTKASFGHYQFNGAMKLAKVLQQKPRSIAEEIQAAYQKRFEDTSFIEKIELAGPGFINIWLTPQFLQECIHALVTKPNLAITSSEKQRIIIDFSSPNTAKEMHVGHLRSTIIGDSLARTFEFLGHDVLRLNHIGDWGTSFGMLIVHLKEAAHNPKTLKNALTLTDLVTYYREAKQLFDSDPTFKKLAQEEVVKLQSGDSETVEFWKIICEISRKAYDEIYDLLDIHLVERGESFYNPQLAEVVCDLEQKNLITISEGAKCIYVEGFYNRDGDPLPLMVQKSDGGYNYDTTDMAAIRHRVHDEKGNRLIYVTDAGQAVHFAMIFKAAEMAGYFDPEKVRLDHVPFGLVLGADNKKFRTRSGDTEKLVDLLQAAIDRAHLILKERNPDWSETESRDTAKTLGINAVKYSDLACHRMSDYVFSYDRMLRFEGNTAAFVMYSFVRVHGIQRKVGDEAVGHARTKTVLLEHPSEITLALHLARFSEVIEGVCQELLPHRYTEYLFELAEIFNAFFRDCRVEGSKEQDSRLLLVEATKRVLETGLALLGLSTVTKM